ncbi:hypothetical protein PARMER_02372 [Parabacteroides merdae ATCC 43184]|nr:hypothetical protein PARMER_02372 [Parabacteroides merdae ATCC 43184]
MAFFIAFYQNDVLNCMNCQLSIINCQSNFVPLRVIFWN